MLGVQSRVHVRLRPYISLRRHLAAPEDCESQGAMLWQGDESNITMKSRQQSKGFNSSVSPFRHSSSSPFRFLTGQSEIEQHHRDLSELKIGPNDAEVQQHQHLLKSPLARCADLSLAQAPHGPGQALAGQCSRERRC